MPKSCKKGSILRSGFTAVRRNKHRGSPTIYHVAATCVKDEGKPGKGPRVIPKLKSGRLGHVGYKNVLKMSLQERHKALREALHAYGVQATIAMLNAVYVLNSNTKPKLAARFKEDRDWLHKFTKRGMKQEKK